MVVGTWLGVRGCGVVDVGWGGVGRTKEPPFFIRYEREKMGALVFPSSYLS